MTIILDGKTGEFVSHHDPFVLLRDRLSSLRQSHVSGLIASGYGLGRHVEHCGESYDNGGWVSGQEPDSCDFGSFSVMRYDIGQPPAVKESLREIVLKVVKALFNKENDEQS